MTTEQNGGRWRQARRNPKVVTGAAILVFFGLVVVAHPVLQGTVWSGQGRLYDPVIGYDHLITHPSSPSGTHWLGTDSLGRDVASMFTYAARASVTVALSSGVAIAIVALGLGSVAAYRRGWVDGLVTHTSDAMVLLPALLAVWVLGVGRPDRQFGALEVGVAFGIIYGKAPRLTAGRIHPSKRHVRLSTVNAQGSIAVGSDLIGRGSHLAGHQVLVPRNDLDGTSSAAAG